jgi:hypothetical protein
LWDAPAPGAFELRTSVDGLTWSPWTAPVETFAEGVTRAGHVDLAAAAQLISYRVPDPANAPTWLSFEPMDEIPAPLPDEEVIAPDEDEAVTLRAGWIQSRGEWGARNPRCVTPMGSPYRATIHHTAGPTNDTVTVPQRLRQVQAYHMFSRGWCDIAYNFLISRDGRIWRGRGALRQGGHTYAENDGNEGICFIGTYTSIEINAAQFDSVVKLLRYLHGRFPRIELNRADVKGHRQYGARFGSTECPGNRLYNRLEEILAAARQ